MKKLIVCIALMFAMTMMFAGCGGAGLSMDLSDETTCVINLDKADADDFAMSGTLEVGKAGKISVDQAIEGDGEVSVQFISTAGTDALDENASEEELQDAINTDNAALEIKLAGTSQETYELDQGSYYVNVTVLKKASGTATIKAE